MVPHTEDGTFPFAGNGLLSRVHGKITCPTIGWKFAHLEIGDIVSIDASMDDHCLYFGQTWDQKAFLVTHITLGLDRVDLELFDTRALY